MQITVRELKVLLEKEVSGPGVKMFLYSADGKTRWLLEEEQVV